MSAGNSVNSQIQVQIRIRAENKSTNVGETIWSARKYIGVSLRIKAFNLWPCGRDFQALKESVSAGDSGVSEVRVSGEWVGTYNLRQ
jgi:hypothetical protein